MKSGELKPSPPTSQRWKTSTATAFLACVCTSVSLSRAQRAYTLKQSGLLQFPLHFADRWRAAEFIFPIRRSLRISTLTQGMLCIAAVQGPLLRLLSANSVPPVSAFSIRGVIFEQDSCPQLLHHQFEPTFMNTITAK